MIFRAYQSNIATAWTQERQEALFATIPGWPDSVSLYSDEVPLKRRRTHDTSTMEGRAAITRPTKRGPSGETVYVASLACLAYNEADLLSVLRAFSDRHTTVKVLDIDMTILPEAISAEAQEVCAALRYARRRAGSVPGALLGGQVSGRRRLAAAQAACARVADRWKLPKRDHPTQDLAAEAGVSPATLVAHLGRRRDAIRRHEIAVARAKRVTRTTTMSEDVND